MVNGVERFAVPPSGLWGFSHCAFYDSWYPWCGAPFEERLKRITGDLVRSGANSFRPHIHWHRVEPVLLWDISSVDTVTGEMVEAYATAGEGVSWKPYDNLIDTLARSGMEPHMVLGAAYDFQIPAFQSEGVYLKAIPDNIGRDRYLGSLYLHARAAVRRYKDRVHVWQLENELNGAGETMLFARWRTGRSWLDSGFLTAIMEVLRDAVQREDATALTSHNFHTDARVLAGFYDWRKDVHRWLAYLDVIGVDSYPNYPFGWPVRGSAVGRKVAQAREAGEGRPVMVLESGYAVRPRHRGNNENRQARYVRDALLSSAEAGARGFYYYELCSPEGYPVEGPWSNRFFQSIEPWWGMVRRDDSYRPSWFEYRRTLEEIRGAGSRILP